jgi:uncharacterized membrane protein
MLSDPETILRATLALLAGVGVLISLYFVLVHHKLIRPDARFVPNVCRMDEETCGTILLRPEARLLGIPNFYLGFVYYGLALSMVFSGTELLLLDPAGAAAIMSGWLAFALLVRLKINCILCFVSHSINLLMLLLLLLLWALSPSSTTIAT